MKGKRRPDRPQYQRIANVLRDALMKLGGQPTQPLPAEQMLARTYGVARGTIRSALHVLESQGLVRRGVGRVAVTCPAGIRAWQRTRHSRRIHLIIPRENTSGAWYGQIRAGILAAAQEAGYECTSQVTQSRFPSFQPDVRPEDAKQVLGVICVGTLDDRLIAMHAEAGYPVVCVDYVSNHPLVDAAMTDCFSEGQQAVDLLLRHGHRELFYVGKNIISEVPPPERPEPDAVLMEAGYRYALRLAGLSRSVDRVRFILPPRADYDELCRWIASLQPRPTAGVVFSSVCLNRLLAEMPRHQIRCPEDLSLICKCDRSAPLEAACLVTDGFRLGTIAVQTLLMRANGKQEAGLRIGVASTVQRGITLGFAPGSGPPR